MQAVGIVLLESTSYHVPLSKPNDSLCQGRLGWNPFLGLLVLFEVNSPPPHISLGKITKQCLVVEWHLE